MELLLCSFLSGWPASDSNALIFSCGLAIVLFVAP